MPRRALSKLQAHPFLPLACLVFIVNLLTMPAEFYRGDPHSIRMSSLQLIKNGRFSIQEDKAPTLGTMTQPEGKYFFHNSKSHLFFSKYGVFDTLLFTPPLLVEDLIHGVENFYDYERPTANRSIPFYTRSLILMLNLYNILLSVGLAYYFFRITGFFSKHLASRYFFVLIVLYTTFLWNYLRAQSSEIFQILFFAGFFYHFVRFHRLSARRDLLVSTLFAGALAFTKQCYFLLFPIAAVAAWITTKKDGREQVLRLMAVPMAGFVLIALALNAWQFGSPFEVGYGQWKAADGQPNDCFSPAYVPAALVGFLSRADRSVFLHFPPLAVSLLGVAAFARKNRFEFVFAYAIFGIFLLLIANFRNWAGQWCYGPRYLLFILPMISLPLLSVLDWVLEKIRTIAGAAACGLILIVLLASTWLQICLNSLPFVAVYELSGHYSKFESPEANAYFENHHFGLICADLIAHRREGRPFPPLEVLRKTAPAGQQPLVEQLDQLQKSSDFSANYYFFGTGDTQPE